MRRRWALLIAVLISVGLAGCYTIFTHPNVGMGNDVGAATVGHFQSRCSDCHTGTDYYMNNYPYYYDSYWRYPRWWSYYCNPWWWSDYWDYDEGNGGTQLPVGRSQYWDSRERPAERPIVVPGGTAGGSTGSSTPATVDNKKSTRAKSGDKETETSKTTNYWSRRSRPPRPPAKTEEKPKAEEKSKSEQKKSSDKNTKERK